MTATETEALDRENPEQNGAGAAEQAAPERLVRDGIVPNMSFEEYLDGPEVSKSSLWTMYSRSPAHARVEKEESSAMKIGTALHCAILEPAAFEERFHRGPETRRGNVWKAAVEEFGKGCLTSGDYDAAIKVRDLVAKDTTLMRLVEGSMREVSAFFEDEVTGLRCRIRPDAVNTAIKLGIDLKTTGDAREYQFRSRAFGPLGYHVQEPFYMDGWNLAGGDMDGFVFIVMEQKEPFAYKLYDVKQSAVDEGRAIYRKCLDRWAALVEMCGDNPWPGYESGIQSLDLRPFEYVETTPDD